MKKVLSAALALTLLCSLAVPMASAAEPVIGLKEKYTLVGGRQELKNHSGMEYVEEANWAAPIVVDLDGDGKLELVTAAYTLTVADAATGKVKWQVNAGKDRSTPYKSYDQGGNVSKGMVFCTPIVKDFNGDGKLEIAIAYANGSVSLLNNQGYFMPGWPQSTGDNSVWALAADDLDGDGKQEIIAGLGVEHSVSLYVYGCDGNLKPGWPQAQPGGKLPASYVDGIYGNGIATGDLDGDGLPEIIAPTDNQMVSAFNGDGTPVMVSSKFQHDDKDRFSYGGQIPWSAVGFYEDYGRELKRENGGWGTELQYESLAQKGRSGTVGPVMTFSTARYVDVDGDGVSEVVVSALMIDRTPTFLDPNNRDASSVKDSLYNTVYILNQDHTRFNKGGYNWEKIPTNIDSGSQLGAPLNQSFGGMNAGVRPVPVVADVNGDGVNEILFNASDGKVHCYSLKNSSEELAGWPYTLPNSNVGKQIYEMATEPVVADLNGDGRMEVIFASWISNGAGEDKKAGVDGTLYVLDGSGKLVTKHKLHSSIYEYDGAKTDNGAYAAPVVADIDGDGKAEILVNTRRYGVCAYDVTPGAATQEPQRVNPNVQKVQVNGNKTFNLYTYMYKDENYVGVRDLAWQLTNTIPYSAKPYPKALFNVTWDGDIKLTTGALYVPNGSECKLHFVGPQTYRMSADPVLVNGVRKDIRYIVLTDANGGETTYYRLRDLGSALGTFTVGWDPATGYATITTK